MVARETATHVMKDGSIQAGNIAYLSIVTLFPLVILITAATHFFGRTDAGQAVIVGFLESLPLQVAQFLQPIITEVLGVRTGNLLWMGGLVALWTISRFVETIRDIFYRAYGAELRRPAWMSRLLSAGAVLLAMLVLLVGFLSQLLLLGALRYLDQIIPYSMVIPSWVDFSRFVPPLLVFAALWAIFKLLAPLECRDSPAWPGALLTTAAWVGAALLLGPILSTFGGMNMTYGALSGVMVTMLFFYVVGLALVVGGHLNAALANLQRPT